ncbi:MAG: nucleoside hydrolase [Dermatophilaceae bacterium]
MVRVILDVDTGVDDAMALLLAARHPGLELVAVTCVAGNARVDDVVRNTLTVLHAAGRDTVPVARGADRPLLEPMGPPPGTHGRDGMGDLRWPAPERRPDPRHAVELLRDTLLDAARVARLVTLVTLAPLTNVALLLRTWPGAAAGLGEIVVMGGSFGAAGVNATAEFNIRQDPEAAAVVLAATSEQGVPVTMYGQDVFFAPAVSVAQAQQLVDVGSRGAAELAGRLMAAQCGRFESASATIGDAGAVCAVLDPGGRVLAQATVTVALSGRRGRTSTTPASPGSPGTSTVRVVTQVDGPRYAALWLAAMR